MAFLASSTALTTALIVLYVCHAAVRPTTAEVAEATTAGFSFSHPVKSFNIPEASLKNPVNASKAVPRRFTPCSPSFIPNKLLTKSPTIPNTSPIAEPILIKVSRILSAILTICVAAPSENPRASKMSILSCLLNDPKIISKNV